MTPMPPEALRDLQAYLRRLGFTLGTGGPLSDGVDGDWGPLTAQALTAYISGNLPTAEPAAPKPLSGPQPIPPGYGWLKRMTPDVMPRTIWCGLKELGVKELAGAANSPTIMAWAEEVGLKATYTADAVPWCGLLCAVIVKRAGKPMVDGPLWALNWKNFGSPVGQPGLGDVLVFQRTGGGHVGFYVGEDASAYHVLGGNQGDQVSIARVEKKRLVAARRPIYKIQPPAVKPYILAADGAISTNEQ